MDIHERVHGMLAASVVAEALAGPHIGPPAANGPDNYRKGGWIHQLAPYAKCSQSPFGVFPEEAPAGTLTSGSHLRLHIVQMMCNHQKRFPGEKLSREDIARGLCSRYQNRFNWFNRGWMKYNHMPNADREKFRGEVRAALTELLFWWEIAKTATRDFLPKAPPMFSPPAKQATSEADNSDWEIQAASSKPVMAAATGSVFGDFYTHGAALPIGLIAYMHLAAYLPGQPAAAFDYLSQVNGLDAGEASLHTAVMGAMLADIIAGKTWLEIRGAILEKSLDQYIGTNSGSRLAHLESIMAAAFKISESTAGQNIASQSQVTAFIENLRKQFGSEGNLPGSPDEVLAVTMALLDFGINQDMSHILTAAVNYGPQSQVAPVIACLAGAASGAKEVPTEWLISIQEANPDIDLDRIAGELSALSAQ